MPRRHHLIVVVAAFLLVAAACGRSSDGPSAAAPEVAAMTLDPFPAPTGEVVLTIVGADRPNVGDEVQLDIESIEALGATTVTLHEPFLDSDLEFTGVPVDMVLAAAGVGANEGLTWIALDEYQVFYTRSEAAHDHALVATRQNGKPIPVDEGGPIRVVFIEADGELGRDTNQWIWGVTHVDVG